VRRWLREPLLHFLLLGVALFVFDALLGSHEVEARDDEIVVSEGRIENLAAVFTKIWSRPPTAGELRGLVDDYVLEEVLYRESLSLGLDRDDTVLRRRLRQKMEFVVDDLVDLAEPEEADLEAWLAERPDQYAQPGRFRFRQVYLSPEHRGASLRDDAERLLEDLRTGRVAAAEEAGDATLLPFTVADRDAETVAETFGPEFVDFLASAPEREWSGPVASSFGLHLVHVDEKVDRVVPPLSDVREAVERDWRFARREEASKRVYEEMRSRYRVSIEWPAELQVP
jgi:hypothetical protein